MGNGTPHGQQSPCPHTLCMLTLCWCGCRRVEWLQGSKSQNKTDWPSNIPLLLGTFRPVGSGTVILRDSVVRVQHLDELITYVCFNVLFSARGRAVGCCAAPTERWQMGFNAPCWCVATPAAACPAGVLTRFTGRCAGLGA